MRCPALYLGSLYWLEPVIQTFLYFLAVDDANIFINRVKLRVEQGGHNVNPDVIKQRYTTDLALLKHYKDFPDVLILEEKQSMESLKETKLIHDVKKVYKKRERICIE